MPVRTGAQYIAGLKDRAVEIYVSGERVKDVTTHPGMSNGVHSIARLYDLQQDAPVAQGYFAGLHGSTATHQASARFIVEIGSEGLSPGEVNSST